MQPVEINAGTVYLRAIRADERMDDTPALTDLGITDPDYVARADADWDQDLRYTWAVCEPTTGEMLGEIALDPGTGAMTVRARPGQADVIAVAADPVRRFADALGIPNP